MKFKSLITAITFLITSMQLFSQSDCDILLQYGIFNEAKNSIQTNNYKQEIQNSCDQLDEAISKSNSVGGGVSFAGFGLSGNYSNTELTNIKKLYCQHQSLTETKDEIKQTYSRIVAPEVLSAFLKCRELTENKEIQLKLFSTNEDFSQIIISLTGLFATRSLAPSFQKIVIDTNVFKIKDSDLYDAANEGKKLDRNYTLALERKISTIENTQITKDKHGLNKKILSKESLIGINLNNKSLVINIPEISYWVEPVYINSPLIGQVITSVLDSTTFFYKFSRDEWMLANGQAVPVSAVDFRKMYGANVPDLRGVFIRGKNYSRNDEYKNPSGDLPNGYKQTDEIQSHAHLFYSTLIGYGFGGHGGGDNNTVISADPAKPSNATQSSTGAETRPKNVTLSYYIRIRVKSN